MDQLSLLLNARHLLVRLQEPIFLTGYLLSYDAISLLYMEDEKQKKQEYQQKIFYAA